MLSVSQMKSKETKGGKFPRNMWCEPLFWNAVPIHCVANNDNKVGTVNYFFQQKSLKDEQYEEI